MNNTNETVTKELELITKRQIDIFELKSSISDRKKKSEFSSIIEQLQDAIST